MRINLHCLVVLIMCSVLPSPLVGQSAEQSKVGTDLLSQRISLQLHDVPVTTALDEIAARAAVPILYSRDLLPSELRVTVDVRDRPLWDVLDAVMANTGRRAQVTPQNEIMLAPAPPAGASSPTPERQQGTITGRVTDAESGRPVADAAVEIQALQMRVFTDSAGYYELTDVPSGQHRVSVRRLGFAERVRTVTVAPGEAVVLDFDVAISAVPLDQIIVAGTVVRTAVRTIPSPITVITAADIEREGVRNVNDLLRGQVPGVISPDNGQAAEANAAGRGVYVRGSTTLTSPATANAIKTYIDGVEVTNPRLIHSIDPAMIERIEILRGPQASTIYGSGALSGVMHIFTKRGKEGQRPTATVDMSLGGIESSHFNNVAPQADVAMSVAGSSGTLSYNVGSTYRYEGSWTPDWFLDSRSGFGSLSFRQGQVSADVSARFSRRESTQGRNPVVLERIRRGEYTFTPSGVVPFNNDYDNRAHTLGLTLRYEPLSNWRHQLTLGRDEATFDGGRAEPTFYHVADTLTNRFRINDGRTSWSYNTSLDVGLASWLSGTITAGTDNSRRARITHFTGQTQLQERRERNRGMFGQAQFEANERFYVTAGLRAEDNPAFGDDIGWNLAPRFGIAYVHDFGGNSIKLRTSAGKATRPPMPGQTEQRLITPTQLHLANPELGPEYQSGIDFGFDLYLGGHASLEVTRYDQTVRDLIYEVYTFENLAQPNPDGYVRVRQHQNLGDVRNQGWELQSRTNFGRLDLRGTYTVMDSRIEAIREGFRGTEEPGDRLPGVARSTASLMGSYTARWAAAAVSVNYVGRARLLDMRAFETARRDRIATAPPNQSDFMTDDYPGVTRVNLSTSLTAFRDAQIYLRVDNVLDSYHNDVNNDVPARGRLSTLGVRWRF